MTFCPPGVRRITSKDLLITLQPAGYPFLESSGACPVYGTDQNFVGTLVQSGVTLDTFKLRVNGYLTEALAGDVASDDLQLALEGLPNVATDDLGVTGVAVAGAGTHTITAAGALLNEFIIIEVVDAEEEDTAVFAYTTFGSKAYDLTAELSSFGYSGTMETVDATGINEEARVHLATVTDMTWDVMLYEAIQTWRHLVIEGLPCWLTVYEQGVGTGKRFFAFSALVTDVSPDMPQFEKVEISFSGRRQGAYIIPPGSYQGEYVPAT